MTPSDGPELSAELVMVKRLLFGGKLMVLTKILGDRQGYTRSQNEKISLNDTSNGHGKMIRAYELTLSEERIATLRYKRVVVNNF